MLAGPGFDERDHRERDTLTTAGIAIKKTRPYRPQTNGRVERIDWHSREPLAAQPRHGAAYQTRPMDAVFWARVSSLPAAG